MLQLVNAVAQFEPGHGENRAEEHENGAAEHENRAAERLRQFILDCGCDGAEIICNGTEEPLWACSEYAVGYHMMFYADWMDFWNGNTKALSRKFGSEAVWQEFYGGRGRSALVGQFHQDLLRAERIGARYVVFHVSDVSIEEGFSYQWEHNDKEVVDAAAELINLLLDGQDYTFEFLMENLHWPGLTFTDPEITHRLLDGVNYEKKGIMLDTGHLMCTNLNIRDQSEGCRYLLQMLEEHADLNRYIRGVHLHQSVSGNYVMSALERQPELAGDYSARFAQAYDHIGRIDTHQPFDCSAVREVLDRIAPEYLVHELAAKTQEEKMQKVKVQQAALRLAT